LWPSDHASTLKTSRNPRSISGQWIGDLRLQTCLPPFSRNAAACRPSRGGSPLCHGRGALGHHAGAAHHELSRSNEGGPHGQGPAGWGTRPKHTRAGSSAVAIAETKKEGPAAMGRESDVPYKHQVSSSDAVYARQLQLLDALFSYTPLGVGQGSSSHTTVTRSPVSWSSARVDGRGSHEA
jgi:hypothetical protein